jgi:hypothetical protein
MNAQEVALHVFNCNYNYTPECEDCVLISPEECPCFYGCSCPTNYDHKEEDK